MAAIEPSPPADPPLRGPTRRTIAALRPSLVPSEARVATALLDVEPPLEAWSVARVAALAGVSSATVVRACQSLGFEGFNGLRDVLAHEASGAAGVLDGDGPQDAIEAVRRTLAAGREQIDSMAAMLDAEALERAVATLAEARRVLVVTMSDLAMLGQYAVFRLSMIGRPAETSSDVITLHAVAAQLQPGDACLAIGHSGTNQLTVRIARAAAGAGASVVAVTSFARGPLAEVADVHLPVGSVDPANLIHDQTRIRVAQMLMIDALQNAIALRRDTREAASTMHHALSQYAHRR